MKSNPKLALALDGSWRHRFEGIAVGTCIVDIENRMIVGYNTAHQVTSDLRLNDDRVTAFLRIRRRNAPPAEGVIIAITGGYDVTQMKLLGSYLLNPEHHVTVTISRQVVSR